MGGSCTKEKGVLEREVEYSTMPGLIDENPFKMDVLLSEMMDIETINEAMIMTKDELTSRIKDLTEAFKSFDYTSIHLQSHTIKGIGATMACSVIKDSALPVEKYALYSMDPSFTTDMTVMNDFISKLVREVSFVISYIESNYTG